MSDTTKHPSIAFVEQIYQKYFAKDVEGILIMLAHDVSWNCHASKQICPIAGSYHGHDGVKECFAVDFAEVSNNMIVGEFSCSDSTVTVNGTGTYTIRATGKTYSGTWKHIFVLENNKIKRLDMYVDVECIYQ